MSGRRGPPGRRVGWAGLCGGATDVAMAKGYYDDEGYD